jgi:hypothetical protein
MPSMGGVAPYGAEAKAVIAREVGLQNLEPRGDGCALTCEILSDDVDQRGDATLVLLGEASRDFATRPMGEDGQGNERRHDERD